MSKFIRYNTLPSIVNCIMYLDVPFEGVTPLYESKSNVIVPFPIVDKMGFIQLNMNTLHELLSQSNLLDILNYIYNEVDWNDKMKYIKVEHYENEINHFLNN